MDIKPETLAVLRSIALWKLPAVGEPVACGNAFPDLPTMQGFVGGYLELIGLEIGGEPVSLFVIDDERDQPLNPYATGLLAQADGGHVGLASLEELNAPPFYLPRELAIRGNAWAWFGPLPDEEIR